MGGERRNKTTRKLKRRAIQKQQNGGVTSERVKIEGLQRKSVFLSVNTFKRERETRTNTEDTVQRQRDSG